MQSKTFHFTQKNHVVYLSSADKQLNFSCKILYIYTPCCYPPREIAKIRHARVHGDINLPFPSASCFSIREHTEEGLPRHLAPSLLSLFMSRMDYSDRTLAAPTTRLRCKTTSINFSTHTKPFLRDGFCSTGCTNHVP